MAAPITVSVYDYDLDEYAADPLAQVLDVAWLDEFNGVGSGRVTVPLGSADAAALQKHRLVELYYEDDCRFAFSVEQLDVNVVAEAGAGTVTASGRGLLAWLGDGVLVPEAPVGTPQGGTRPFNFCDPGGFYKTLGVTWDWCESVSTSHPDGWPDSAAQWIRATAGSGTVGSYMKSVMAVTGDKRFRVAVAATAPFTVLVDGWEVMALGARTGYSEFRTVDINLKSGGHAVGVVSPSAGCQALVVVREISETTGNLTTVHLRSDTTWQGTTDGPAWTVGDVLRTSIYAAEDRDITRLGWLTTSFSDVVDTAGNPWTARVWREWPAGTDLLTLATDLVEFGCDIAIDPYTWSLRLWNARGSDLSASVALTPGVNIVAYSVTDAFVEISNVWVVRDSGQTWESWGITDSVKREGVVTAGDTLRNSDVAAFAGQAIYSTRPGPVVSNATCIPVDGATPYVDFEVGDTITAPGIDGSPVRARVMGLSVQLDGESVTFTPDLELGAAGTRRFALEADGKYAQTLARQTWDGSLGGRVANASPLEGLGGGSDNPFGVTDTNGDLGNLPGAVIASDTEPGSPGDGQMWLDTSTEPPTLNAWDEGTGEWWPVSGAVEVFIGDTEPATDSGFKLWIDTSGA